MKKNQSETHINNDGGDEGELIAVMERLQATYGYLPQDKLRIVATETGRSLVEQRKRAPRRAGALILVAVAVAAAGLTL